MRVLDFYAIQATLTGVDDVVRKLASLQQAFAKTQAVVASLALAGATASIGLLGASTKLAYQLDRVAGAVHRLWAGEGDAMVQWLERLSSRTGAAFEVLARAAVTLGAMGASAGQARRILRLATDIAGAMELPDEMVGELAQNIARLGDPMLAGRALRALRRFGLDLRGIEVGPTVQAQVIARLQTRFAGGLGAFQELDSILQQVVATARLFIAYVGAPIIRLFSEGRGALRPLLDAMLRLQQLTGGWFGLSLVLGVLYLSVRKLLTLWHMVIGAQLRMAVAAETLAASVTHATAAMNAASVKQAATSGTAAVAAGTAAGAAAGIVARLGLKRLVAFIPYIGQALAIAWLLWDVINNILPQRDKSVNTNTNSLRNIERNTEKTASAIEGLAKALMVGGGERAQRTFANAELQLALAKALGAGVA